MEHIIQFGVTIDEQRIIDHATGRATEAIISKVQKEINEYTRGWQESKLHYLFRDEVKKVVDAHKDEIIEGAVKVLATNMVRTKAVKDMIARMEEIDDR